jgi:hypothetical protein
LDAGVEDGRPRKGQSQGQVVSDARR